MKISPFSPILSHLTRLCLLLLVLLPVLSWVLAAVGCDVHSVLSAEGHRTMTLHIHEYLLPRWLSYVCCLILSVGCLQECRFLQLPRLWYEGVSQRQGIVAAIVILLVLGSALLVPFFNTGSALRSVTGGLFPSPWLYGFPFGFAAALYLASLCYLVLSGTRRALEAIPLLLSSGIQRHALFLIDLVLFNLILNIAIYVFS